MRRKSINIESISYDELETSSYFRGLDWDKLKHFYYVAKVGNISHAAQMLNTTQSSYSRHISGLENYLGYPLFSRNRNGVILTHRGQELYQIVERVFFTIKGYTHLKKNPMKAGQRRKIRIATNHVLASYLINNLLLKYNKDHPEFIFEILETNDPIDVVFHNIDIAIQPKRSTETDELWQVIQESCFSLTMSFYASEGYLSKRGVPHSLEDLTGHSLILPSTSTKVILDIIGQNNDSKPKLVFQSDSFECLVEAAQQDKGIVCLYDQLTIVRDSNLKSILPDCTLQDCQQYFVCPKYLKEDQEILNIKNYLIKRLGDLEASTRCS